MTAEVGLAFSGFHQSFTTRNTHVPGREVHLKLVDGPFSNLDGVWKFTPVGGGGRASMPRRTQPQLWLQQLRASGPGGARVRQDRLEPGRSFVKRAEHVYGTPDAASHGGLFAGAT
jgi:hypothetical protein